MKKHKKPSLGWTARRLTNVEHIEKIGLANKTLRTKVNNGKLTEIFSFMVVVKSVAKRKYAFGLMKRWRRRRSSVLVIHYTSLWCENVTFTRTTPFSKDYWGRTYRRKGYTGSKIMIIDWVIKKKKYIFNWTPPRDFTINYYIYLYYCISIIQQINMLL